MNTVKAGGILCTIHDAYDLLMHNYLNTSPHTFALILFFNKHGWNILPGQFVPLQVQLVQAIKADWLWHKPTYTVMHTNAILRHMFC